MADRSLYAQDIVARICALLRAELPAEIVLINTEVGDATLAVTAPESADIQSRHERLSATTILPQGWDGIFVRVARSRDNHVATRGQCRTEHTIEVHVFADSQVVRSAEGEISPPGYERSLILGRAVQLAIARELTGTVGVYTARMTEQVPVPLPKTPTIFAARQTWEVWQETYSARGEA